MSEFATNTPNDDSFNPGENFLYPQEDFLPACKLLSQLTGRPEEELWQFLDDYRNQVRRGDYTLVAASRGDSDLSSSRRLPHEDLAPMASISETQIKEWGAVTSWATWANQVIQIDDQIGEQNEHITRSLLLDPKSSFYVGESTAEACEDLPALRASVAELGGAGEVGLSLEKLAHELEIQTGWAYTVQGINSLGGLTFGLMAFTNMQSRYRHLATDAIKMSQTNTFDMRLLQLQAMQQTIASYFAPQKLSSSNKINFFISFSQKMQDRESAYEYGTRMLERLSTIARRTIQEEAMQKAEQDRAVRADQLHAEYVHHAEQAMPPLSGKARKRFGYEKMWHTLIGRDGNTQTAMVDHEAENVLSAVHALRTMVEDSFGGVYEAHEWQQQTHAYEQAIKDEYNTLGRLKDLPVKEGVAARLEWLRQNWDIVAEQLRTVADFPVQRVAGALFPEVAKTIQEQEQTKESQRTTVAQRLGSDALEQLVLNEVDWEILPIENIAERISAEAQSMTQRKRSPDTGRQGIQEVRVRDLIELSTLFDDARVHVSREKDGITRRKNEPYFVITFTYADQRFALAENLVLDNATFILPQSEYSWKDVFSLPRGAVGEFGAKRIYHPTTNEVGEYEAGPSAHVDAIFAKLDATISKA